MSDKTKVVILKERTRYSYACRCLLDSTGKKLTKTEKMSNWRIIDYKCNYSHFEYPKGAKHYSDYSLVECIVCKAMWRTKAGYVDELDYSKRG